MVQRSARAIMAMLDVPGFPESQRLPKAVAVAVVSTLNVTAHLRARLQQVRFAGSPRHDVIDLECHAHAKQQRRGDDIGEVESQAKRGSTRRRRPGTVCSA